MHIDPTGGSWVSVRQAFADYGELLRKVARAKVLSIELAMMGFTNQTQSSIIECQNTLDAYGIDTPEEKAHFFAQCAAETNFGLWLTELGTENYFNDNGYGIKYRGAGYIQLTWDFNYKAFSKDIGDSRIYSEGAEYVATNYAWHAAGWFWANNNMNDKIANGATVSDITRVVRGSASGWEDRQKYYDQFIVIFS